MTGPGPARVRALLGGSCYQKLFAAARRRLEEAGEVARSLTLPDLDDVERAAVADLMGWPALPSGPVRIEVAALDAALQTSAVGAPLRDIVEVLGGTLRDRRSERDALRTDRERMWSDACRRLEAAGRSDLIPWIEGLRTSGALARAARSSGRNEARVLEDAEKVALRLPASGKLLSVFASEVVGDPHALDPGTPLGSLALRAAVTLASWSEVPTAAPRRRRLWQEVGIDCDPLSAQVLVLGLRPSGDGRLARHLREHAADGEPRRVTLRELAGSEIAVPAGARVFACENPAIAAAAADALGAAAAALVCVEGVPSTAAMELLRRLAAAGADLRVRADLDWAGLRIAGQVMAETGAQPWRFRASDYTAALAVGRAGPCLAGWPAPSPWDERLSAAMAEAGVGVPEERLLVELLEDLKSA